MSKRFSFVALAVALPLASMSEMKSPALSRTVS